MLFSDLIVNKKVLEALEKNGYTEPTKIQEEVIRIAMEGKSIIGQSQTGTGKTAAFVIPLLQLVDSNIRKPQVVVLAPTRELAMQIREEFFKLSDGMYVRSVAVYGGSNIRAQREILEKWPQIVVATPGRLIDLIERRFIDLSGVQYFVLDEVDRMLDMGFIDDIDTIWSRLGTVKQSMTFSATIPQEVKNLVAKYVGDGYESIKATESVTVNAIDHSFIEVPHFEKYEMLKKYIDQHKEQKVVVFVRMKHETEEIADLLERDGYSTGCLHGDMQQRDRTRSLKRFQDGLCSIFVTTDVASRGLNMKDIELVVNYHVPEDPEAYIHRIGRTGRAGATGKAIMFVTNQEQRLVQNIERTNKIKIKQIDIHGTEVVRIERTSGGNGGHHRYGSRRSFGGGGNRSGRGSYGWPSSASRTGGYSGGRSSGGSYARRDEGSSERPRYGSDRPASAGYQPRSSGYQGSDRPQRSGGYEKSYQPSDRSGYRGGNDRQQSDRDNAHQSGGFKSHTPRSTGGADWFSEKSGGGQPRPGNDWEGRKDRSGYDTEKRSYSPPRSRDEARPERKWPSRDQKDV